MSRSHGRRRAGEHSSHSMRVIQHVRGSGSVLRARPILLELGRRYGQLDVIQDLAYFLQKPGLMRRTPHVVLLEGNGEPEQQNPRGALLIHESRPLGVPTGAFAVSDRSGRGVVLGRAEERLDLAIQASGHLMRTGANLIMLTFQGEASEDRAAALIKQQGLSRLAWSVRTRPCPSYLLLQPTYDATLATLGKKTRLNLRYYRRRAEAELGCRFVPEANISVHELIAFNADSMFPQPKHVMRWRLALQKQLQQPYLMGMQDRHGRWLSLIGGRRFGASTEILWQMNRGGMPRQSLVSAMRSYLIEHETGRGAERLYIEGGTPHSILNSFETDTVTDLVLVRPWLKSVVSRFAARYVPTDNVLADMLRDQATVWQTC